jgi:hypothetical protein
MPNADTGGRSDQPLDGQGAEVGPGGAESDDARAVPADEQPALFPE